MRILSVLTVLFFTITSCSKSPAPVKEVSPPEKTLLSLPAQNEACTSGTVISATESRITLTWKASLNTTSYEVSIKNLLTGNLVNLPAAKPELEVVLLRSTPYSWYVTSRSSATALTAVSDTWKFYNAGPGAITYAPFPAEIVAPVMGHVFSTGIGNVRLEWKGSDADSDIVSYDVFLGTAEPILFKKDVSDSFMADISLSPQSTYYWKVISKDSKGNTSDSGVYQFRLN